MIQLTSFEKKWINLCKGNLQDKYPFTGEWSNTLRPLFVEIYGWPDDNSNDYLHTLVEVLFDLYLKIADDKSGNNLQLKSLLNVAMFKTISYNSDSSIQRVIGKLCGLIQSSQVQGRYELD